MKINQKCPVCGNDFEDEAVPGPEGEAAEPCPECQDKISTIIKIEAYIDIRKILSLDEIELLKEEIKKACLKRGYELKEITARFI